jgi:hypothetical protein
VELDNNDDRTVLSQLAFLSPLVEILEDGDDILVCDVYGKEVDGAAPDDPDW